MRYKSSELSNLLTAHHHGGLAAVGDCPTAVALDDDGDADTLQYVARVHLESDYLLLRAIRFSSTSWQYSGLVVVVVGGENGSNLNRGTSLMHFHRVII